MWKESYRLGVDLIDKQHIQLFQMVENLLLLIEKDQAGVNKKEYIDAIEFMKNYVVYHFKEEEGYQASIHYADIENHIKEHREFVRTVLGFEKQLIDTNYDMKIVKQFAGKLVAWLIYHVADTDQKIVGNKAKVMGEQGTDVANYFINATASVFETMFDIVLSQEEAIKMAGDKLPGSIFVKIGITGDFESNVLFGFSKELALHIMKIMTFMELREIDEMVCSAVAEIANIITGTAATELAAAKYVCDITPPEVSLADDTFHNIQVSHIELVDITPPIGELWFTVLKED